ncbi:MAG: Gfo/Idh/MocA family oxidoreductase [Actinobacteria bacterium]|nr:Gfo/Idh/MocA family oxidoreductase [Actinomycetota bacterium]
MSAKLRVGVIGAGVWAQVSHIPTLLERADEIELVGVCRKGRAELDEVARKFGFAMASEDYRDVLDAGIDVCIVSSPVGFHHEQAIAAMEAGAHVLVEKPVTIDPADAWDIAARAEQLGKHVVVAFGWNYLPTFVEAQQLWRDGGVGTIEHVLVHMASGTRELLDGTSLFSAGPTEAVVDTRTWTDPAISGGGYGQAQLTHILAWALGVTGLRAEQVFAFGSQPAGAPVELHDTFSVRCRGGATGAVSGASFHSGSQSDRHQYEIRVFGSEGHLHADLERDRLWLWRTDRPEVDVPLPLNAGAYHCRGPIHALLDLAQGRDVVNRSPIELGARTVEVLAAAYASMRSGSAEAAS